MLLLASCSNDTSVNEIDNPVNEDPNPKVEDPASENPNANSDLITDNFDGTGDLIDWVTNNPESLPAVGRSNGRYLAEVTNNDTNITLHFNGRQGRLDAKLVSFPFEFVARNIGIGTIEDSQTAPVSDNNPFVFSGVQVHVEDFNSINSSHVVVGHRGNSAFTVEGKNTVDGGSNVNDIGANEVPEGRADIRIVGTEDRDLIVYWQRPNLDYETVEDTWNLYRGSGNLPGSTPVYGQNVYVGLITYAYGSNGLPFVGTCDAVTIN